MSDFLFCLHGLSPGDCTMGIQSLEENHLPRTPSIQQTLDDIISAVIDASDSLNKY